MANAFDNIAATFAIALFIFLVAFVLFAAGGFETLRRRLNDQESRLRRIENALRHVETPLDALERTRDEPGAPTRPAQTHIKEAGSF